MNLEIKGIPKVRIAKDKRPGTFVPGVNSPSDGGEILDERREDLGKGRTDMFGKGIATNLCVCV